MLALYGDGRQAEALVSCQARARSGLARAWHTSGTCVIGGM
jgi:hypothetical protein